MVSVPAKKRLRAVSSRFSIVNSEFGLFFSWGGGGGGKTGVGEVAKGAELLWGLQKQ